MGSLDFSPPAQSLSPLDPEELRRQGYKIIDYIADYYKNIEKYPVRSPVEPGYLKSRTPDSAPNEPEPFEKILHDITSHIVPGLTHWVSPTYFALFNGTTSNAAFLGEVLSVGFNVCGFNWISSPAATELEMIVIDWFGKMLNLPSSFLFSGGGGGTIQGTTCEAVLSTLTAARDQMLRKIGRENIGKLVVYMSDQTHFCFEKAAQIAGINPCNFRVIPTTKATQFGLSPDSLRSSIVADVNAGLVPLYLCATIGTTVTTAVDPLGPLCEITKEYGIWVHVDAAYAGSSCVCPEFRHFLDGIEGVDSFTLNAHKWFFAALDCCCLWVKDPSALIKALSTKPDYLRNSATDANQAVDYKDWQITLSRRFRALKLWIVLRSYGVVNLQKFIREHVNMAKHFQSLVGMDERFEIVVPRNFALVCFRLSPKALHGILKITSEERVNEINKQLLESLNASGHVYMTHGFVGGIYLLRFVVGASLTDYRHVDMAWKLIQEHADASLNALSTSQGSVKWK